MVCTIYSTRVSVSKKGDKNSLKETCSYTVCHSSNKRSHIMSIINWHPWVESHFFLSFKELFFLSYGSLICCLFCLLVFAISFVCSGKKGGEVDLTFSLNYTKIESGLVDTDDTKTFVLVVRRLCLKTGRCFTVAFA